MDASPGRNERDTIAMITAFVHWNVDPIMLTLGPFQLRYYSLLWASGLILGYFLLLRFARTESLPERVMDRLALYCTVGVIIGARLGHCYVYEPAYYFAHPLEVLQVWKGGLASHGGIVGVLIGMYIASRQEKVTMLWVMDRVSIPIAMIASFIRLGNLMNSEIYGLYTDLPWGFIFERRGEVLASHPTQIYESLSYFAVFILLLTLYYRWPKIRQKQGLIFGLAMVIMFAARILIEFIKNNQEVFEDGWPLNLGQLQSLPFWFFGVGLVVYAIRREPVPAPVLLSDEEYEAQRKGRKGNNRKASRRRGR